MKLAAKPRSSSSPRVCRPARSSRHRPHLHLRRDGGCAPLSRAERSVREDRGDCLKAPLRQRRHRVRRTGFLSGGSSMKMDIGPTFSRRSLALGFVVVLAFPVAPVFAGREHRAREDAAQKFLGSIYQRYLGKSSAAATGVPLTNAQSVRSYFTFALASLILEDRAAATKQRESPALGTDPFIGRLEWDVSDLSVDVKDTAGFKTAGTVTFITFCEPA